MKDREEHNRYARAWYAKHRDEVLARDKLRIRTPEQKERHLESSRKYYARKRAEKPIVIKPIRLVIKAQKIILTNEERLEKRRIIKRLYYQKNKEKIKEWDRQKYLRRKEKIQKKNRENRELINKKYIEHTSKRMCEDPIFKLSRNVPKLIRISIKRCGYSKKSKTYSILGCTYDEFKTHIENKFENWMGWHNWGKYKNTFKYGWDLDHIIPISLAKTEEDIIKLNHYTNFQPLDSFVNRYIKRNNTIYEGSCNNNNI